jgi:hypothetical protein
MAPSGGNQLGDDEDGVASWVAGLPGSVATAMEYGLRLLPATVGEAVHHSVRYVNLLHAVENDASLLVGPKLSAVAYMQLPHSVGSVLSGNVPSKQVHSGHRITSET